MKAAFPYSTRRACLRSLSDGASLSDIERRHSVNRSTFRTWAKQAGVTSGSKITDAELDAKIQQWAHLTRELPEEADATPHQKRVRERKNTAKFGMPEEQKAKNIAAFEGSSLDPKEYLAAVDQHMSGAVAQLRDPSLTPEGQVNLLTLQVLLVQLKGMVDCPPPVLTWSDAEKVIRLLRLTLGMDNKEGGDSPKGVNLRILNG